MNENDLIIAKYECNAKQFLFPKPQLRPKYSRSSRSLIMDSSFLSIGPKLEFSTINSIIENDCDLQLSGNESESELDSVNSDL